MPATPTQPLTDAATVAARWLTEHGDAVAAAVAAALTGAAGAARTGCENTTADLIQHLARAVESDSTALIADHVRWARLIQDQRELSLPGMAAVLAQIDAALARELPPAALAAVRVHLDAARSDADVESAEPGSFLGDDAALAPLARGYLDALLAGDRHRASRLVLDAVESGTEIRSIYLDVFQRCQWEIGRLWQLNRVSVAQEHFCTAATQLVMSQLYDRIFSTDKLGRTLVAACATHDLHELGIRMVSDFFEMEGWDTYYLGADTPVADIVGECIDRRADVLAVSLTIGAQLDQVRAVIDAVRAESRCAATRILVGGYPFALDPDLWRKIGADATAGDALGAVAVANRLLDGGAR